MSEKVLTPLPQTAASLSQVIVPNHGRRRAYRVASSFLLSVRYAAAGCHYAFSTQRNFRIQTVMGTLAMSLGIGLRLPGVELAVLAITVALVMSLELLNTAIESVVDLTVGKTYHELAKIAKDCAAGAVLITAVLSMLVACFLLLPPILNWVANSVVYI